MILDFVESKQIDVLPTPYEVAKMMKESGVWVYPLGSPPPIIVDDEDV
jgi:hypothetical protein